MAPASPYYTNFYTNALRKRLFHSRNRAALHVRKHVGVGVERDGDGPVPQHLGDDLGVDVFEQQYGCGGVTQLVKRHRRKPGTLEERCKRPAQVSEVDERTLAGAKD
jgi:hypothetical protein